MIIADGLTLVLIVGLLIFALVSLITWARRSARHEREERRLNAKMSDDLGTALKSRDYRQLDDWLVMYADRAGADICKHVQIRRDELYVDENN